MAKFNITSEKQTMMFPPRVEEYFSYLKTIKGKSENTVKAYTYDMAVFLKYMKVFKGLESTEKDFDEIYISDLTDDFFKGISLSNLYSYMSFVEKQRENSTYSRARKVASLRTFFKYLYSKARIIEFDPTTDLESPRIRKRNPVYLTLDESVELLKNMDKTSRDYKRDYCILTLFLNTGMRLSELVSIKRDFFREDTLNIIGKGNKERVVYLNKACMQAVKDHIESMSLDGVLPEYRDYLFLSNHKKPISKRTVERLVKKYISSAGLSTQKYTPHKLRHTAATLMYKHGNVDIRSLQSILGHENLSTTQIYTHVDDEKLRESVKSNPLADIDDFE